MSGFSALTVAGAVLDFHQLPNTTPYVPLEALSE